MNRSLPERNSQHMNAALAAASAATDAITLPLVFSVALATVALVAIAVFVGRSRHLGRLTGVTAAASVVSAAGILASALLVNVAIGGSTSTSANDAFRSGAPRPDAGSSVVLVLLPVGSPTTGDLSGPQLSTE